MKTTINKYELWTILAKHYGIEGRDVLNIIIEFDDYSMVLASKPPHPPVYFPRDDESLFTAVVAMEKVGHA